MRPYLGDLLAEANTQLTAIPDTEHRPSWAGQLTLLEEARTGMESTHAAWQAVREALPTRAVPGTQEYDEPLAERNAEAWGYLCDWATYSHTLNDIAAAGQPILPPNPKSAEHARTHPDGTLPPSAPARHRPHPGRA